MYIKYSSKGAAKTWFMELLSFTFLLIFQIYNICPDHLRSPSHFLCSEVSSFLKGACHMLCWVLWLWPICHHFKVPSFPKAVLPEDLLTMYRKDFTKEVLLPRGPPKIKYGKKPGPFKYTNKGIVPRESAEGQAGLDLLSAHKLSLKRPLESKEIPSGREKLKTPKKATVIDLRYSTFLKFKMSSMNWDFPDLICLT